MFEAVNAACNNMGTGTIDIWNSGDSGNDYGGSNVYAIRPQANQVLDFHGYTVNCNSSGELAVAVYGDRKSGITVRNLVVTGDPRYGVWFRGCSDLTLTNITMNLSRPSQVGLGIRVDASTGPASNLTINGDININGSLGHAIETYAINGVNIGDVTVNNSGGCGVLLNDSDNCRVGVVTGSYNNQGGGYATFRVANNNRSTYCAGVYSRNSGRGFFSVSGSRDCTVEWVDIANTTRQGIFLEDASNTHVLHGRVSNGNPNTQLVRTTNCSINLDGQVGGGGSDSNKVTIQENVSGFCGVDGTVDSNNSGYTGSGFANTSNATSSGVDWRITGDAGDYTFRWRYANGSSSNRSGVLYINGTAVSTRDFGGTGSWTSWTTTSVTVYNVTSGTKTLRLQANQGAGLANIDYLEVTGPGVSSASCSSGRMSSVSQIAKPEMLAEGLKIYPQPASSQIYVGEKGAFSGTIAIYSLSGQLIQSGVLSETNNQMNVEHLKGGVYLLKIKSINGEYSTRMVKN